MLTIRDDVGPILVRPSHAVPDDVIPHLIVAWRTGRDIGRREGRNWLRADITKWAKVVEISGARIQ